MDPTFSPRLKQMAAVKLIDGLHGHQLGYFAATSLRYKGHDVVGQHVWPFLCEEPSREATNCISKQNQIPEKRSTNRLKKLSSWISC
jgi:hypothetical protein